MLRRQRRSAVTAAAASLRLHPHSEALLLDDQLRDAPGGMKVVSHDQAGSTITASH